MGDETRLHHSGPQTDALRAFLACTGAQMLTGPAVRMPRSSTPPIVHAATRPDTADTAAAPDTQDFTCITHKPKLTKTVAPGTPQDPNTRKTAASSVPQVPDFKTTREPTARNTSKSNLHTPDNLQPNFFAVSETLTIQSTSCPPASLQGRQRDVGAY
ncbi:hypothetical protein BC826DRAFT_668816 [Russula brevipes]|nr:hypothetical protein BC826DRAFT_668816 [Russula brevipes]